MTTPPPSQPGKEVFAKFIRQAVGPDADIDFWWDIYSKSGLRELHRREAVKDALKLCQPLSVESDICRTYRTPKDIARILNKWLATPTDKPKET